MDDGHGEQGCASLGTRTLSKEGEGGGGPPECKPKLKDGGALELDWRTRTDNPGGLRDLGRVEEMNAFNSEMRELYRVTVWVSAGCASIDQNRYKLALSLSVPLQILHQLLTR